MNVRLSSHASDDADANLKLVLKEETLEALSFSGKDITVYVTDQEGKELYSWNFQHDLLAASKSKMADVDLTLKVSSMSTFDTKKQPNTGENGIGLLVDFGYEGILPSQANIRVFVGDLPGVIPDNRVYLYHVNPKTGKLETLPYSSNCQVDKDGYIKFDVIHCSDYAVLFQEAPSEAITSLKDQITVTPAKKLLYTGAGNPSYTQIAVKLPATLELVDSSDHKTSQPAIGSVTVTYHSGNNKVAKVNKEGKISAMGNGSTDIITTVTLYSGKTKTFRTKVTVKAPSIIISGKETMKVGDTFPFNAKADGFDSNNITWLTTKKSIIVIDKKTGSAVAKTKGIDYVVAKVGEVSVKTKVKVI